MRARVALTLAAVLVASAAATPALAAKRRVPVPLFHCAIYVETNELYLGANQNGAQVYRYGHNHVSSDC